MLLVRLLGSARKEPAACDRPGRRPVDGAGLELVRAGVRPAAPVVSFLDYYYHAHEHDLAGEAGPETAPAYFHWRRSMAAIDLLDLEQAALAWTPTSWQRGLYPAEYRDSFLVLHDGVDTRRFTASSRPAGRSDSRSIAGRVIPGSTRVVTFVARSLDRLRGLDRFLTLAERLAAVFPGRDLRRRGRPDSCAGDWTSVFHNHDYAAHLLATIHP